MPDPDELVVVRVDDPDPDPVVVLVTPPSLGDVAVVAIDAPPEEAGLRQHHEHRQIEPATAWIVDHDLGRPPIAWSLFDTEGRLRDEYIVELPTVNRAVVRLDGPTAGTFRCL